MNIRQLDCSTVSCSFFSFFFSHLWTIIRTIQERMSREQGDTIMSTSLISLPLTFWGNISVEKSFKHGSNMHYHIYSLARGIRAWFDTTANDFFFLSVLKSCPLLFWSSHVASHTLPFFGTLLTPTPILRSTPTTYPLLPDPLPKAPPQTFWFTPTLCWCLYGNEINTK